MINIGIKMGEDEFNVKEQLVKLQYRLLYKGFSLEHHLKTVEKLPEKSRLKYYEKLLRGGWVNKKQYENLIG